MGTFTEMELDAIVPEQFVPLKPAEAATKLEPAFDTIAVVRYAGRLTLTPLVLTVIEPPVIAPFVPAPAPPGAATLMEMALDAIVPEQFVPLKLAEAATKLEPAFDTIAVVRYAGRLTLTPLVFTVIEPPVIAPFVPAAT